MRGLRRELKVFLCLILLVSIMAIGMENILTVKAKGKPAASVTKKTLFVKGSPYKIKVKNASNKAVITYSTSNKAVAKVSKTGVITPVKSGTATVTVKIVQGGSWYSSKIVVTVKKQEIIGLLRYGSKEVSSCYNNDDYNLFVYLPNLLKYNYSYSLSSDGIINVTDSYEEYGVYHIFFKTLKLGNVTIMVKEKNSGITYKKKINIIKSDAEVKYDGKIVYFGSYPQSEVTGEELTDDIINAEYYNHEATVNGIQYVRFTYKNVNYSIDSSYQWDWVTEEEKVPYHYFRYEPLAWRVINDSDDTLLLLSDRVLYSENYNNSSEAITWEKSDIRKELNTDFFKQAFKEEEQKKIVTAALENKDTKVVFRYDDERNKVIEDTNNGKGGKGGKATKDKVFLLSLDEMLNPEYWSGMKKKDSVLLRANPLTSRMAYSTDYALFSGCMANSKIRSSEWMLRSPAETNYYVSLVSYSGDVSSYGADSWTAHFGIRPAIKIKRTQLNN